jgi:YD repeat-containing protein
MKPFCSLLLFVLALPLGLAQTAEIGTNPQPSEREQSGLHGPVKLCVEESTMPGTLDADGEPTREWRTWFQTEYDVDGRALARLNRNPDGSEWETRYTYNAAGKLLKAANSNQGESADVTTYNYDAQGRDKSIVSSTAPDNPVTFRYDEQGRKTKIQVSRAEDYRPNVGTAADSPLMSADRPPNLQGGGTALTTYDEHDRPIEVQVRDAQGAVMSRTVRNYDKQGNIAEEKQIWDDPLNVLPPEARTSVLETGGITADEFRAQLTNLIGGHSGPVSIANTYDTQGRVQQTLRRVFNEEATITKTYNSQGDVISEVTRSKKIGSQAQEGPLTPETEARYRYEYDDHGNWTEKITSQSLAPGGAFEITSKMQRTLTYF